MLRTRILTLLLAAGPAACGAGSPTRPDPVALDKEVTLAPGGTVAVKGQDVEVGFESVTEDSRCPTSVQCVWMGEVKARLTFRRGGEETTTKEVREGEALVVPGFRVTLVRVTPYPTSTAKVPAPDYRATLKVSTAP